MKKKIVSQKKKMRNGLQAQIVDYRSADDIDVRFDDGRVVRGATYRDFADGNVSPRGGDQS